MRRSIAPALSLVTLLACTTSTPFNGKGDGAVQDGGGGADAGRGGTTGAAGKGGSTGVAGTPGVAGTSGVAGTPGVAGSSARGGSGGSAAGSSGAAGAAGSAAGSGGSATARGGSGGSATARGGSGGSATGVAGSGGSGAAGKGGSTGAAGAGRGGSTGAAGAVAGSSGTAGSGTGGTPGGAGSTGSGGAPPWSAGNPNGSCSSAIPAKGQPADVSTPTKVIGTGTAASCTFAALNTAVTAGGVITFNCGPDPVTISVTATMNLPTNRNTVIDGGRRITLDGGGTTQILNFNHGDFLANDFGLTLQHIAIVNGKSTPTVMIPTAPAPCSQGWNDGMGGAIYMRDGYLVVIDSIFTNNKGAPLGPDTGGGAIYVVGSKGGVWIVNSTFTNNQASNAGAVGCLFAELNVYNSLFSGNKAIGHDANNNDPDRCDVINNNQNEVGSGGNGGALYSDGNDKNVTLCGNSITGNAAGTNAFGGGLFFTSNNLEGVLTIRDTTMTGNTGGSWTNAASGSVTNVGSAVGTNCKSITLSNSTIQGL